VRLGFEKQFPVDSSRFSDFFLPFTQKDFATPSGEAEV